MNYVNVVNKKPHQLAITKWLEEHMDNISNAKFYYDAISESWEIHMVRDEPHEDFVLCYFTTHKPKKIFYNCVPRDLDRDVFKSYLATFTRKAKIEALKDL